MAVVSSGGRDGVGGWEGGREGGGGREGEREVGRRGREEGKETEKESKRNGSGMRRGGRDERAGGREGGRMGGWEREKESRGTVQGCVAAAFCQRIVACEMAVKRSPNCLTDCSFASRLSPRPRPELPPRQSYSWTSLARTHAVLSPTARRFGR